MARLTLTDSEGRSIISLEEPEMLDFLANWDYVEEPALGSCSTPRRAWRASKPFEFDTRLNYVMTREEEPRH